ncbi:type I-C CRISPR-associated protein Cas5c [Dehalococcoidia bacterium]|nr:type I-C CRISPR-associated protein Cas5c [Dehalococcoidia bacterium]
MNTGPPLEVKVWGEFGCFTRPEMKVERVSYPVMTPSAARGTLEAIFWKPEFHWQVREIVVLKPIRHHSILRNEVAGLASVISARRWEKEGGGYLADDKRQRQQRHTLALRDVAYIIRADVVLAPHGQNEEPAKYRDQFRRRVAKGQCHYAPYLGCREFAAAFGPPGEKDKPIDLSDDLGLMLFDMDYAPDKSGRGEPRFFLARLKSGVLQVPDYLYKETGEG